MGKITVKDIFVNPKYLAGQDLSYLDLTGIDFTESNLGDSDLRGAKLNKTTMTGAYLRGANLSQADLRGVNLKKADLSSTNLQKADLFFAKLREADLNHADLTESDLRKADFRQAYLRKANLSRANLAGSDLSFADLSMANLTGACLHDANLIHANLRGAYGLEDVVFTERTFDGKVFKLRARRVKTKPFTPNPNKKPTRNYTERLQRFILQQTTEKDVQDRLHKIRSKEKNQGISREKMNEREYLRKHRDKIEKATYPKKSKETSVQGSQLNWEMLPPNWWNEPGRRLQVVAHIKDKKQAALVLERLEYLETFKPREVYISYFNNGGFPYYAFVFTKCVVAENPLEGNAIYLIRGVEEWQKLLRMSKQSLRRIYEYRITKIVHRGNWKGRLRKGIENS